MGWMQRLTCREAARWMSARQDEPLSRWRSFALRLHLRLCGDCRAVDRQLVSLQRLARDLWDEDDGAPPPRR